MKLLSVLGTFAMSTKPPKTVALATPVLEISASVEELSKQATKPQPKMKPMQTPSKPEPVADISNAIEPIKELAQPSSSDNSSFDWNSLVEHARTHYVALYSVLSKCDYELAGDQLTLYTVNAFYKKKLDDPKYSAHLYESLQTLGGYQLTIHTLPTSAPLKDVQAASIADIMGGGIEVSPELVPN